MNAQYITDRGFAQYLSKYVVKREPSHIFNIYKNDSLREHIITRRLESMELIFLLLDHTICNSSTTVKFLTTDPPTTRTRTVLPAHLIEEDDENPFYDDTVMKYMSRLIFLNSTTLLILSILKNTQFLHHHPQHQHHDKFFKMIYPTLLSNIQKK